MSSRLDLKSPLREGFLFKEGGGTKSWKKRYFALYPGLLVYYANYGKYRRDREKNTLQGKINEIKVVSCTVSRPSPSPRPCSFIVHTNDEGKLNKRSDYVLSACSTEDLNAWIACLAAQSSSQASDSHQRSPSLANPVTEAPVTEVQRTDEEDEDEDEDEDDREEQQLISAEADDEVPEPAYAKVKKKTGADVVPYLRDSLMNLSDEEKTSAQSPKTKRIRRQATVDDDDDEYDSTTTDDGEIDGVVTMESDSGTSSDSEEEEEEVKVNEKSDEMTDGERRRSATYDSAAAIEPMTLLKEGILLKQGGRYKSWKHRFFRLTPGLLMYYKTKKETTLLSKVRLDGAQIVEPKGATKKPYQFSVVTINEWNKRNIYVLSASSAEEKAAWVEAFKKATSESKRAEFGTYDRRIKSGENHSPSPRSSRKKFDIAQKKRASFSITESQPREEKAVVAVAAAAAVTVTAAAAAASGPKQKREERAFLGQVVQLRSTSGTARPLSSMKMVSMEERDEERKVSKVRLRALVSKEKKRFVNSEFDLDLTYVTNRLIAMGYPSEGAEAIYRNKMSDVQRFFETRHKGHYKIYNLCSERAYPANKFANRVAYYPFDDHCAPPLAMLAAFCNDLHSWLTADGDNVAVAHCKAGKGRTGCMLSAYLLHCSACESAEEALYYYGQARTFNGKGVTIPSQKRYVYYYEQILKRGLNSSERKTRTLEHIRMMTVPNVDALGGCNPYYVLYENNEMKYSTKKSDQPVERQKGQKIVIVSGSYPLMGDIQLQLWDYDRFSDDQLLCNFFFNTLFIENNKLSFSRTEIDKAFQKKRKEFSEDFRIELVFSDEASCK